MSMKMIPKQTQLAIYIAAFVFATERIAFTDAFAPQKSKTLAAYSVNLHSRNLARNAKLKSDAPDENSTAEDNNMNPLTKASWYAVEVFGKVFGDGTKNNKEEDVSESSQDVDLTRGPLSMEEALVRIRMDNDRSYFLSGEVDKLAYDEQCVFSDPFVSFSGRDRFVDNLSNLGSFITEYDAKMLKYDVVQDEEQTQVQTKVMVKLELNLPWKPILAWPWGVTYDIDKETLLIKTHAESWDIEPLEGVKQIFRKPTTRINSK